MADLKWFYRIGWFVVIAQLLLFPVNIFCFMVTHRLTNFTGAIGNVLCSAVLIWAMWHFKKNQSK